MEKTEHARVIRGALDEIQARRERLARGQVAVSLEPLPATTTATLRDRTAGGERATVSRAGRRPHSPQHEILWITRTLVRLWPKTGQQETMGTVEFVRRATLADVRVLVDEFHPLPQRRQYEFYHPGLRIPIDPSDERNLRADEYDRIIVVALPRPSKQPPAFPSVATRETQVIHAASPFDDQSVQKKQALESTVVPAEQHKPRRRNKSPQETEASSVKELHYENQMIDGVLCDLTVREFEGEGTAGNSATVLEGELAGVCTPLKILPTADVARFISYLNQPRSAKGQVDSVDAGVHLFKSVVSLLRIRGGNLSRDDVSLEVDHPSYQEIRSISGQEQTNLEEEVPSSTAVVDVSCALSDSDMDVTATCVSSPTVIETMPTQEDMFSWYKPRQIRLEILERDSSSIDKFSELKGKPFKVTDAEHSLLGGIYTSDFSTLDSWLADGLEALYFLYHASVTAAGKDKMALDRTRQDRLRWIIQRIVNSDPSVWRKAELRISVVHDANLRSMLLERLVSFSRDRKELTKLVDQAVFLPALMGFMDSKAKQAAKSLSDALLAPTMSEPSPFALDFLAMTKTALDNFSLGCGKLDIFLQDLVFRACDIRKVNEKRAALGLSRVSASGEFSLLTHHQCMLLASDYGLRMRPRWDQSAMVPGKKNRYIFHGDDSIGVEFVYVRRKLDRSQTVVAAVHTFKLLCMGETHTSESKTLAPLNRIQRRFLEQMGLPSLVECIDFFQPGDMRSILEDGLDMQGVTNCLSYIQNTVKITVDSVCDAQRKAIFAVLPLAEALCVSSELEQITKALSEFVSHRLYVADNQVLLYLFALRNILRMFGNHLANMQVSVLLESGFLRRLLVYSRRRSSYVPELASNILWILANSLPNQTTLSAQLQEQFDLHDESRGDLPGLVKPGIVVLMENIQTKLGHVQSIECDAGALAALLRDQTNGVMFFASYRFSHVTRWIDMIRSAGFLSRSDKDRQQSLLDRILRSSKNHGHREGYTVPLTTREKELLQLCELARICLVYFSRSDTSSLLLESGRTKASIIPLLDDKNPLVLHAVLGCMVVHVAAHRDRSSELLEPRIIDRVFGLCFDSAYSPTQAKALLCTRMLMGDIRCLQHPYKLRGRLLQSIQPLIDCLKCTDLDVKKQAIELAVSIVS
ncbi:hypothetical protein Poli38472_010653 [Pythium oligandrum]|uniref:Uncharacterized protein n=1 Tax=Pythium oligandrum TaxID=41045 RepID=A0A8K1FB57_PYTOL|nr:hypothetical protein Poli38472_010653 [Pythium oligandrum]|eukprot:TMW55771.1 hypothetical protein Poli38472_010653 [Pythium oligandrum]